MAEGCIHYLLYCGNTCTKSRSVLGLRALPLFQYAACYWHTHYHLLPYEQQRSLNSLILSLLLSEQIHDFWIEFQDPYAVASNIAQQEVGMIEGLLPFVVDMELASVAQELIDRGWDPDAKNAYGFTALHRVASSQNTDLALLLLRNGASVSPVNGFNQTPLHFAEISGHKDVVNLLQDWGADISAQNKKGETALHYAAVSNDQSMLKHLLKRGASVDVRTHKGESPLDWARNNTKSAEILVKAGAQVGPRRGSLPSQANTRNLTQTHILTVGDLPIEGVPELNTRSDNTIVIEK
jgi:hypothetical protein